MPDPAKILKLSNGLTVIAERIPHLKSAAYSLNIPCGIIGDREDRIGSSLITAELSCRGAGGYDSKGLSDAFDSLGIRHSEGAGLKSAFYNGSLLSEHLPKALELVSLMVQEPLLPEDEISSVKSLLVQDIRSLLDNPAKRVVAELRKRYLPEPYGRMSLGSIDGIETSSISDVRDLWTERFTPRGSVLSIAGSINPDDVVGWAGEYLGNWQGGEVETPQFGDVNGDGVFHVHEESAQLQIACAFPSASFNDSDYYNARVVSGILSGGMFGRLFIEVREKRGLCYSVYASHSAADVYGLMIVYAGTTPDRAQETINVIAKQIRSLPGTVKSVELKRVKANLKASLVMSQESAESRAGSNATDWWWSGKVRSLSEIEEGIEKVTLESVDAFLERFGADKVMMVTLGSVKLNFPE